MASISKVTLPKMVLQSLHTYFSYRKDNRKESAGP